MRKHYNTNATVSSILALCDNKNESLWHSVAASGLFKGYKYYKYNNNIIITKVKFYKLKYICVELNSE